MHVFLLATLDTKGDEAAFVRDRLGALGVPVKLVDTGSYGAPTVIADVSRHELFRAAGHDVEAVRARGDRGQAVTQAAQGARALVLEAHRRGELAGVLALGGSAGTIIGTEAMRALPIGIPKLMVSTLAAGQVGQYVGDRDIFMLNPVVDIAGLNRVLRQVLSQAARAMAGLVARTADEPGRELAAQAERPVIAVTMFGVTTPCVAQARRRLETAGYETLVFHAIGSGGRTMERLIRDGTFAGVLDLTTTELADELVGGFLSAGPDRLTAAGEHGVPQVVSVGATDMANFYAPASVPERFRSRRFHAHNAEVTLMRTTAQENALIGADIGRKLARARGPVRVLLPLRGVSALDAAGQPFDDPEARRALFAALRENAGGVEVTELDHHINDAAFAEAAASALLELMQRQGTQKETP